MPYILNAIPLGSTSATSLQFGRLAAEPDEPPLSDLVVRQHRLEGVRYLIVTDDGSGYRSSAELVHVPKAATENSVLSVPKGLSGDLERLLSAISKQSPVEQLAVYLEANRIISRPKKGELHPADPVF